MDESRLGEWYKIGMMVESDQWAKSWGDKHDTHDKLIGILIEDRCPQCGARTWLNRNGNQWCWNCNWDGFLYYFNNYINILPEF